MSQPAWIQLSAAAVKSADLTPAEIAALQAIQESDAKLSEKIGEVIAEFRQAILDGGGQIEEAPTIPPGFKSQASALARWRWLTSFPALPAFKTKAREEAAKVAEQLLTDIALGKRKVAAPPLPGDAAPANHSAKLLSDPCQHPYRELGNV